VPIRRLTGTTAPLDLLIAELVGIAGLDQLSHPSSLTAQEEARLVAIMDSSVSKASRRGRRTAGSIAAWATLRFRTFVRLHT
jgi:hypothetical protein